MNISNYYWYFESAIPPRICDLIVKYGKAEKEREIMAITGGFGRDRDLSKNPLNKEEVKDLERLLEEAQRRLNNEYDNIGGRTWWQWVWYIAGWHYD